MTKHITFVATIVILVGAFGGCSGESQVVETPQKLNASDSTDSIDRAIQRTMEEARRAIDDLGVTEAAMPRIEAALDRLAQNPGLKEEKEGELREVHGGGVASAVLASEIDNGLTLILARFQPGKSTPVHDHGTWAVAYVLEGRDRYTQWERLDDGNDPQHAELKVKSETLLRPGDTVHWLNPPHDIHSQQAIDVFAWELILFGSNPLQGTLHYFDPATGRVEEKKPQ